NDTVFYVVSVNLFGCSGSDTVMIVVRPNPVANAGPDQFICGSGTVQLGSPTTAGYTYTWTPSTGLSSSTISDPILNVSNSGSTPDTLIFTVTTTLNGCTTTDLVQVINSPAPTAIAGPDTVLCSGNSVVIGSGSLANYVYTWTPSTGLSSSTISDPTVTLTNTSGVNDTVYYVLNTGLFGCFDNDTVMIVVKPNPVANAGSDATLCSGDTVTLGTAPTAGYTYSWSPPTNLSSTTISDPFAVITNFGTGQTSITYTVVTTLNGCITTDSVTITVNPQPSVTASVNPGSICAGGSATLTASGATGYSWALSTSPATSISTDSAFVVSPSATTTYILTGTNSSSCSNSDTITITVNPLPVVQISAPTFTICNGDTLILTGSGASNYTWSVLGGGTIGSGTSIQVFPSTNTSYVVIGTDGNSCSNSDTVSVTVNPAATLTSLFGNTSVCPGVTGVQYYVNNPDPNSSYTWIVTNGTITSGQGTDTIYVDWSVNSGIGIVSVVESTNQGCLSNPVILQVTINVFLTPVAPSGPTAFCANDAHGAIYTTLNTPGSLYMWNTQGGTIVSGDSTSTVTVDWNVTGPQIVLLWYQEISFTSVDTCYGISDTLSVTINPAPVTSPISGPTNICVSHDGSFSVANTPSSTYNWSATGGNIVAGNTTNSITANWPASGNSTITVIETNVFGCKDTVNLPVNINVQPEASFTLDDSNLDSLTCRGFIATLANNSDNALNYLWLLPDGTTSTIVNPQVQLSLSGNNTITLIAYNNMCTDTASNTYESTVIGKLFDKIPNIFSPNGDGKNDCFDLGAKIDLKECSEWEVYNRWGEKVFTSSSSQPCWNGKKNDSGSELPAGTYYLLLKIAEESFKGTITLLR
ncbi:MAG: gliding motility-associated C-terminal domain-containing protein, partial [Bacteroidia bacterium]